MIIFMKFDERNKKKLKSPLFYFHCNCSKVCPTDSDFFGLSRSTRCGCCSYQVSSICVWRVTRYDHFMKFDERNKKKIKIPFFYFHCNCGKVCPTDSDFFGLSRSTRCGCDRKHYCKTLWSLEWNKKKCTLVTMATVAILNFFNPKSCPTLQWIFLQSFMKFDEKNLQKN